MNNDIKRRLLKDLNMAVDDNTNEISKESFSAIIDNYI